MEKTNPRRAGLPQHIGIIMDGNGRWAKKRALPRKYGHREGAKTFRKIVEYCDRIGLQYLTVYAFSTENWKRPKDEVDAIMQLLEQYVDEAFAHKEENQNVRTRFVGDLSALNPTLQQKLERIQKLGEDRTGLMVDVAFNYGGRNEIAHAARCIAQQVREGDAGADHRADGGAEPVYRRSARPGSDHPPERGAEIVQFSNLAVGLFRVCLYGCAVAGFYSGASGTGNRGFPSAAETLWWNLIRCSPKEYLASAGHILWRGESQSFIWMNQRTERFL